MDVKHSLRSDLGRVRALGSAKDGTHHWITLRLTAIALIPLSLYVLGTFFTTVTVGNGYEDALNWLKSPLSALTTILFIGTGVHHGVNGLQEVIEDYIHCECMKIAMLIALKFAAATLALAGILAVLKVFLGA